MKRALATKKAFKQGFTLVELSIVLTIVGILLYTTIGIGVAQLEMSKIKSTQEKMERIQSALTIYYRVYGYLPCPAQGSLGLTDPDFGKSGENLSSPTCFATNNPKTGTAATDTVMGVVPVRSLNLPDEYGFDAWDNRISYAMYAGCGPVAVVAGASWATDYNATDTCQTFSKGNALITIKDKSGNIISNKTAYVLISYGKNGIGAWNRPASGGANRNFGTLAASELDNAAINTSTGATSGFDSIFVDTPIIDGDLNYFDDLLHWKTPGQVYYDSTH